MPRSTTWGMGSHDVRGRRRPAAGIVAATLFAGFAGAAPVWSAPSMIVPPVEPSLPIPGDARAGMAAPASSAVDSAATEPGQKTRRPQGDAAFIATPFATPPVFVPLRRSAAMTVERAEITYWKRDGAELGPWKVDLYRAVGSGGRPAALVVILPVAGKAGYSAGFAKSLLRPGLSVLALHPIPEGVDDGILHSLSGTAKTFTEDVANVVRVVRWAAALPGIDSQRIGLVGVSRGAIAGAIAAQIDARLSTVLILGGANMGGLFRTSTKGSLERLRRDELRLAKGNLDAVESKAARILANVDPAARPGRLDPHRTLLINARWDHVIPRAEALALRAAAGGATQYWLPTGHLTALLYLRRVKTLARKHFESTLGLDRR